MTYPIRNRWKRFLVAYAIPVGIGAAGLAVFMGIQHTRYHVADRHARHANVHAVARERLWAESLGVKTIPEGSKQDGVDKLAVLLKPILTDPKNKATTGLTSTALPDALRTASVSQSQAPGVVDKLDWCIFESQPDAAACATSGAFSSTFLAQVSDVLKGNVNPHLHQVQQLPHPHEWPQPSKSNLFGWLFILTTAGYGVAVVSDELTVFSDHDRAKVNTSFPNLLQKDGLPYKLPVLTSPLACAVTLGQNMPSFLNTAISNPLRSRKMKREALEREANLLVEHPKPEVLQEARDVLHELLNLDPRYRGDPDIQMAIERARKTVAAIEEIPEMLKRDEARVQAAELIKRLNPAAQEAFEFTAEHKMLMATQVEPELRRALDSGPTIPTKEKKTTSPGTDPGTVLRKKMTKADPIRPEVVEMGNGNGRPRV